MYNDLFIYASIYMLIKVLKLYFVIKVLLIICASNCIKLSRYMELAEM